MSIISRTIAFFDGQNLYRSAKAAFGYSYPNYDPAKLSQLVCHNKNWQLEAGRFYTGIPSQVDNLFWNSFWLNKYRCLIVWQCELKSVELLNQRLLDFLGGKQTGNIVAKRSKPGDPENYRRRLVVTRFTGRPDLPVGIYILEENRQAHEYDGKISEAVYRAVLVRDKYTCQDCGWTHEQWNRSDPRHLEAHHIKQHVDGGSNTADNLTTLCNICHDVRHKTR